MKLDGDNYLVKLNKNKIIFSGKFEEPDYNRMLEFLIECDNLIGDKEVIIDIKSLAYLNSIGIRLFALYILKTLKKIKIEIESSIAWHNIGITPLVKLKPNGMVEVIK